MDFKYNTHCISCNSDKLTDILSLGAIPIADALLKTPHDNEEMVPCTLTSCNHCGLLQIREIVSPEILFCNNYPYYSSIINELKRHFTESAETIISTLHLTKENFVLEIASNDGVMLEAFKNKDIRVLGIDPAEGPAKIALEKGINTIIDFFGTTTATQIVSKYGQADVILANNVMAHTPYLNDFLKGISIAIKQTGIAIIEVPYAKEMLEKNEFDTIFHQHISYFSISSLIPALERNELYLNAVSLVKIHGGSLRLTVSKQTARDNSVIEFLQAEDMLGITSIDYLKRFKTNINEVKTKLQSILEDLDKKGEKVGAYGAAGKANTLMSYFGIGSNYVFAIGDKNKVKQGLYFTGNKLPVISPNELVEQEPGYILILAWNFSKEIMMELRSIGYKGKFIVPIPEPVII